MRIHFFIFITLQEAVFLNVFFDSFSTLPPGGKVHENKIRVALQLVSSKKKKKSILIFLDIKSHSRFKISPTFPSKIFSYKNERLEVKKNSFPLVASVYVLDCLWENEESSEKSMEWSRGRGLTSVSH